jgi:hypothetical protein
MENPVVTETGHSYERDVLIEHLNKNGPIDPTTRKPISGKFYPNLNVKKATEEFLLQYINLLTIGTHGPSSSGLTKTTGLSSSEYLYMFEVSTSVLIITMNMFTDGYYDPMHEIIPPVEGKGGIYLGGIDAAENTDILTEKGIFSILTIAAGAEYVKYPKEFVPNHHHSRLAASTP